MTTFDATAINVAIIRAFGLDPRKIRKNATIRLDGALGPVITVEMFRFDEAGKMFVDPDGEVATTLKRFKLVEFDDDGT